MSACRSLLLTCLLLAAMVQGHSWRPCTDLLPLDLLTRALPRPGQAPPTQVQMVQSRGSRGFRLAGAEATALSFPASQIFTNCDYFPSEFSLVATVKIPNLRQKTNEHIFSVVEEESDSLLLGLRVSKNRLHFVTTPPGVSRRGRQSFKDVGLDDNRWHTIILAVSGPYATLTVDCGLPLELKQARSFPSALSTRRSRFFVGSRGRWRGRFSGLLRQLVLVPGSDATPRLCPAANPAVAELAVPAILNKPDLILRRTDVTVVPFAVPEAEARVTLGTRPPCSSAEQGQLWFDAQSRGLFICDGPAWTTLLQSTERLDYLEDYQDLYTRSETFDVEVFSIPSEGLFMAAANRDSRPGSGIYRWTDGTFQLYQNISTQEARAWKHFTIDDQVGNTSGRAVDWEFFTVGEEKFLVVANSHDGSSYSLNSVIYRYQGYEGFVPVHSLPTFGCRDWEHFRTEQGRFLLYSSATSRLTRDSNHNIHSVIYRWNPDTQLFEVNQTLSTSGAYDWEFFSVGPYHFLAVANTFDGRTTAISSTIYVWLDGCFQVFQNIPVSVSALSSAVHKQAALNSCRQVSLWGRASALSGSADCECPGQRRGSRFESADSRRWFSGGGGGCLTQPNGYTAALEPVRSGRSPEEELRAGRQQSEAPLEGSGQIAPG
ncbi:thrombospondin-type laminin G domain and EAR repeat-containing protein-like [Stegastes partitus]|uniref:Thrombospondin-type laminin G domain and EAR repeat-containing protein-like n=1 Tax=Stegastes partitus TaxID=144197 RepID=A0A9Y4KKE7_9TELE|nr:PREDICTED: thrombospondin-type laminin G domain and EAR repeat-containing protein-like [Stegastes partitus]